MTRERTARILRRTLPLLWLLSTSALAGPAIVELEDAIEARAVKLVTGLDGRITAEVRACDTCKPTRLAVSGATRAYENGAEVPLERAAYLSGVDVVVFFTIADRTVSRITW